MIYSWRTPTPTGAVAMSVPVRLFDGDDQEITRRAFTVDTVTGRLECPMFNPDNTCPVDPATREPLEEVIFCKPPIRIELIS